MPAAFASLIMLTRGVPVTLALVGGAEREGDRQTGCLREFGHGTDFLGPGALDEIEHELQQAAPGIDHTGGDLLQLGFGRFEARNLMAASRAVG